MLLFGCLPSLAVWYPWMHYSTFATQMRENEKEECTLKLIYFWRKRCFSPVFRNIQYTQFRIKYLKLFKEKLHNIKANNGLWYTNKNAVGKKANVYNVVCLLNKMRAIHCILDDAFEHCANNFCGSTQCTKCLSSFAICVHFESHENSRSNEFQ